MQIAVSAVLISQLSVREAARINDVNYKTLGRYVKLHQAKGEIGQVGYKTIRAVFSVELELLLVDYIKKASQIYHGLTPKNVRELAFKLAKSNNLRMPLTWSEQQFAGVDWFSGFMRRNPSLSIREPEPTSLARMTNFNRVNVDKFFDNLADVMGRGGGYGPQSIYNIDETGVVTVQKPCRIVAEKGVKQVGATVSQERGTLVTLCCGVNALGNAIPPFFVFPRVNFQFQWLATAPPGSAATGHAKATGWMTSENFLEFMKHFEKHAKPTVEHPVLLIMDNHCSHISIEVLNYAKDHFITILSFPPHCSHALQPLDRSVFGPLKTYINQAMDNWMRDPQNANKAMSIHVLPAMVSYAFPKAFTPTNIIAGFRCTGIYPFDRNVFTDVDFMPSFVSDRPLNTEGDPINIVTGNETLIDVLQATPDSPSTSGNISVAIVSPEDIRPFARAAPRDKSKKKRKSGKSAIYTDTPVKNEVELESLKKASKLKTKPKTVATEKISSKKTVAKRNLLKTLGALKTPKNNKDDSSDASDEEALKEMEADMEQSDDDDVSIAESEENVCPDITELGIDNYILVKFTGRSLNCIPSI
jgi:DDE superfamily endonuclease/helix-turn-helix, Psq domain